MSHLFLDHDAGRLALYLHGDLQFDAADERLYHEPLAWLPTALAVARRAASARTEVRVLILGGGDGLALREVLKFRQVVDVHLVERDADVLRLGRNELAVLNHGAFADPRVRVHEMDARDFRPDGHLFDVIIIDLTYPRDMATASLFSTASIRFLTQCLDGQGMLALNAVSPQMTPQAFGCIGRTLHALQLHPVPYSCAIPSFIHSGFGRWGFYLASPQTIAAVEVARLPFPDDTQVTQDVQSFQVPLAAGPAFNAAANETLELVGYLERGSPIAWEGPFGPLTYDQPPALPAPYIATSQQFAAWLQTPDGRHSLGHLLTFIPQPASEPTRQAMVDWSLRAGTSASEATFMNFVNRLFERVDKLPPAWAAEVRQMSASADQHPGNLASPAFHKVLAMFMVMLLYANFLFKDNAYAKPTAQPPRR